MKVLELRSDNPISSQLGREMQKKKREYAPSGLEKEDSTTIINELTRFLFGSQS